MALRGAVTANVDLFVADLAEVIRDIQEDGHGSLRAIVAELQARGIMTRRGGTWLVLNVRNLLKKLDEQVVRRVD